jgi:hypothetical protein
MGFNKFAGMNPNQNTLRAKQHAEEQEVQINFSKSSY